MSEHKFPIRNVADSEYVVVSNPHANSRNAPNLSSVGDLEEHVISGDDIIVRGQEYAQPGIITKEQHNVSHTLNRLLIRGQDYQ